MIWATLALFVVSFIVVALLAPKPEFEDVRADELDPNNFPRATENAPVPLALGCVRVKGPNTLWYGEFRPKAITKKVKTGLFSSETVTVAYKYFLSIDLGICLGPNVALKKIYIDGEEVNPGTLESTTDVEALYTNTDGPWPYGAIVIDVTDDIDLLDVLDLTASELDTLTAAGGLTFSFKWDIYAGLNSDNSPLDYTDDSFFIKALFRKISGGLAISDEDITLTNEIRYLRDFDGPQNRINLRYEGIVPEEARYAALGGRFGLSLFASDYVDVDLTDGLGTYQSISDGAMSFTISGSGIVVSSESFQIYEPELFGGNKEGGGFISDFTFYPGNFDETPNAYLESILGVGNVPAYNGICRVVLEDANIGESAQLRRMEFVVAKYSDLLSNGFGGKIAADSEDMDPAEALYFIMTDTWAGMSIPPDEIDIESFQDASSTLISEGNGVSVLISSAQSGRRAITEILRQIDGILYQDGATGKVVLKLIRDDYDVGALTVYDEDDIIKVNSFNKTSWQDVKSQVKVTYQSREKEDPERVAIAQNMATANMIGQLRTTEISFPFCYDPATANALAARELSVLSTPLFKMQLHMNRNAYNLKPGDVVKISWSEFGLSEIVMRVQRIDIGQLLDNRIVVDVVQDIFSIDDTVFATPEDSSWVDDRPEPETISEFTLVDMPYFYGQLLDSPVADGQGDVIPFAMQPKVESTGFTLISGEETGVLEIDEPVSVEYPIAGRLTADYSRTAGFETGLDSTGFTIDGVVGEDGESAPSVATTAQVRTGEAGIIYVDGEWMGYEGVTDNGDDTYTLTNIRRALFGTVPKEHAENTIVYFLRTNLLGQGIKAGTFSEDDTFYYILLDQVGGTIRDSASETEQSTTLGDVADRPLRPRDLQLDGSRATVPYDASADPTVDLTWSPSDRTNSQVTFEDDASETPDQTEQYDLEVWVDGVQDMTLSDTNISQPYALDLSTASGSEGELRLYSKRTGGDGKTSVGYAWYPFTLSQATMDSTTVTMDDSGTTMDQTS